MSEPRISLAFGLHCTPQPSVLRAVAAFEAAMGGSLTRLPPKAHQDLPVVLTDRGEEHIVEISPEAFWLRVSPLTRLDRFGATAGSLATQFVASSRSVTPKAMELKVELDIPVPDANRALGGYTVASFSWPRKLDLRPEALGKDHFLPTESGRIHLRLSVHPRPEGGHRLRLLISNTHDRVNTSPEVINQAYALCLRGILSVIEGLVSPAYRRLLAPLFISAREGVVKR